MSLALQMAGYALYCFTSTNVQMLTAGGWNAVVVGKEGLSLTSHQGKQKKKLEEPLDVSIGRGFQDKCPSACLSLYFLVPLRNNKPASSSPRFNRAPRSDIQSDTEIFLVGAKPV